MVNRNLITGALVFSLLSFLLPLSNFILLPLYTKYFPPEEFGVLALMTGFSSLVTTIGALRISASITPYYFEFKTAPEKFAQFYNTVIQFTIITGVLTVLIFSLIGPHIFALLFKNDNVLTFFPLGLIALVIGLFNTLKAPYLVRARVEKKVYKYAVFFCINSFTTIVFQLIMIMKFEASVFGVLIARMLSELFGACIILFEVYPSFKSKIKKEYLLNALRFSIPLIPTGFVGWVYAFGDRFFISRYVSLEVLGIYSILITITGLVTMISDALISGIQPYIYDNYANGIKENYKSINTIFKLYLDLVLLFSSFLILLACNLSFFHIRYEYTTIYEYVSIGVIVFLIEAYTKIYTTNLLYVKNTKAILYLSISSVIFVFVLYFLLIPHFGIWGAIFSNVISNGMILVITYFLSQKKLFIPLSFIDFIFLPIIIVLVFIMTQIVIDFEILDYSKASLLQFVFVFILLLFANRKTLTLFK